MFNIKKYSPLVLMIMFALIIMPVSFSCDVDNNLTSDCDNQLEDSQDVLTNIEEDQADDDNDNDKLAEDIAYSTTPSYAEIGYEKGEYKTVNVSVKFDDSYSNALGNVYMFVDVNGEEIEIADVKANATNFEFNLKSISDYLTLEENYISFKVNEDSLSQVISGNHVFNKLMVFGLDNTTRGSSTYLSSPSPSKIVYNLGDSSIVTVNVDYDVCFEDTFYSMFVYINGEDMENRVKIEGVISNATTFKFDLKTISDKLGDNQINTLTFHPHNGALEGTEVGPYTFNPLTVYVGISPEPVYAVLTPEPVTPNINVSTNSPNFGENATVSVSLNKDASGNVTVTVNGVSQTENLKQGYAVINISGLDAGFYNFTVEYSGDSQYGEITTHGIIFVSKIESIYCIENFTAQENANMSHDGSKTYSINLTKDATGNFTVIVDGIVYETRALVNGSASITLSNLSSGNHNITVSYGGDKNHNPFSQNATLNVLEPAKPDVTSDGENTTITTNTSNTIKADKKYSKIIAKNKTFKAKTKVKKYCVTLKSGKYPIKNVKVYVKIKGKRYFAKTNKYGKATFRFKKLTKKGKYTATIKFNGNKSYKSAAKKVRITVKK